MQQFSWIDDKPTLSQTWTDFFKGGIHFGTTTTLLTVLARL